MHQEVCSVGKTVGIFSISDCSGLSQSIVGGATSGQEILSYVGMSNSGESA